MRDSELDSVGESKGEFKPFVPAQTAMAELTFKAVFLGVIMAIVDLMKLEFSRLNKTFVCEKREYLRHHLGQSLLLQDPRLRARGTIGN